jgi:hypothetical protein
MFASRLQSRSADRKQCMHSSVQSSTHSDSDTAAAKFSAAMVSLMACRSWDLEPSRTSHEHGHCSILAISMDSRLIVHVLDPAMNFGIAAFSQSHGFPSKRAGIVRLIVHIRDFRSSELKYLD